jgi:hypothetical protein
MRTAIRIVLLNFAFALCLGAMLAVAAAYSLDSVAFGLPALLAVWVLVQGAMFARKRRGVIVCMVASGCLLLLQLAVLAVFVWWNRGFGNTQQATQSLVFLIWAILGGVFLLGWFWRAKQGVAASEA